MNLSLFLQSLTPSIFSAHFFGTAALAGVLFASLWQGTLLVLLVGLGLRLLPGLTAAARAAVWAIALLVIALHPVLAWAGRAGGAPAEGLLHVETNVSVALVGGWALASLFRLFQLLIGGVELWQTLRAAQPLAAPPAVAELLRAAARQPLLCRSASVTRPCVAGFFRPRLLIPTNLLPKLNETELTQIALHELEHLRRGDDWVNLLQQVALVILPLHPGMFWLNRQMALERELACDDAVLATTRAGKAYAACLAHVAEQSLLRRGLSLAVGALGSWHRRSELTSRVERILRRPERTLSGLRLRVATGFVLAGTVAAGGALAHSPTLVSFGGDPGAAPAGVSPMEALAPMSAARMLPVGSVARTQTSAEAQPHAVLLKAIMPGANHLARSARGRCAARMLHKVTLSTGARRQAAATAHVRLTAWPEDSLHRGEAAVSRLTSRQMRVSYELRDVELPGSEQMASERMGIEVRGYSLPGYELRVVERREVPVAMETQQVWYTAVRYGDGWLVVQL